MCKRRYEQGQGLVEYALILALVAVVVIIILTALGPAIGERLGDIQCSIRYSRQSYVRLSEADGITPLCYEDVPQPNGSTQRVLLGPLLD